ncbi:glycoside hydrolase family 88 protein [Anatilimnocola sp. NA78]|uniref:glycoside hydrolase family 88 protein n=1 Tax=Anatilimnocola sp. NA78 TaxID=3415683 RepID=UPI003CE51073
MRLVVTSISLLLTVLVGSVILADDKSADWQLAAIGVTSKGTEIPVWLSSGSTDIASPVPRILVIGGHDGSVVSTQFVNKLKDWFTENKRPTDKPIHVALIPNVYPDGLPTNLVAADAICGYPFEKGYYDDPQRPEARYLWRWARMFGADLIIDVRVGKTIGYWLPQRDLEAGRKSALARKIPDPRLPDPPADDFVRQVSENGADDLNTPAMIFQITENDWELELKTRIGDWLVSRGPQSTAHRELTRRLNRSALAVATELSTFYGHDLKQVAYIPALAVVGRLRTAEEAKNDEELAALKQLLAPFLSGEKTPTPKSGSEQAGHLLFAELAKQSEGKERDRWIQLCRAAADQIFDKDGKPLKLMPSHNEMSDAVFMATPIICATGKLTGEQKYFDAAVTHFRSMKKLCVREDGLYRHSPLDEAAWGRGNGFPALGLAWALSEFPEDHPAFPELKQEFQNHITALLKHQDAFGCWHQVIDKPGSYREFSSTCMIGWALKRGIDRGWLNPKAHQPALDRAWIAAKQRIGPKGKVVDICTGTGKMKSLRDYYDRPAIWGVDARGGAMALMFSTEMMNGTK